MCIRLFSLVMQLMLQAFEGRKASASLTLKRSSLSLLKYRHHLESITEEGTCITQVRTKQSIRSLRKNNYDLKLYMYLFAIHQYRYRKQQ